MMKLFSQFEHVDKATPLARRLDGNISEGIAHGTGPHDAPKKRFGSQHYFSNIFELVVGMQQYLPKVPLVLENSTMWTAGTSDILAETEHVE